MMAIPAFTVAVLNQGWCVGKWHLIRIKTIPALVPPSSEPRKGQGLPPFDSLNYISFPSLPLWPPCTLSCRAESSPRSWQLWGCLPYCGSGDFWYGTVPWAAQPTVLCQAGQGRADAPGSPSTTAWSCSPRMSKQISWGSHTRPEEESFMWLAAALWRAKMGMLGQQWEQGDAIVG